MWLERLRNPSPRAKRWTTLILFLVALTYLRFTAWYQDRDMIPKFHDEHMHLVQMQMLAHGKLWTQSHPLADFFETFHVLTKPVYAAIYFPGAAIVNVPAVWLGFPFWFIPWLLAAALVAMMYRLGADLLDGVAGLLAALMLISLQWFRYLSLMVMSQSLMALIGVLIILTWLRWRRDQSPRFAAIIGALMGFAAITRPVDALCYSIPIAAAMLIARPRHIALVCVAALPFLAIQIVENVGITGSPFKTPYRLYADLYTRKCPSVSTASTQAPARKPISPSARITTTNSPSPPRARIGSAISRARGSWSAFPCSPQQHSPRRYSSSFSSSFPSHSMTTE